MRTRVIPVLFLLMLLLGIVSSAAPGSSPEPVPPAGGGWTIIGWNNLGMHCMDSDFGAFAILPPYNTVIAQLVDPSGRLVKNPTGITVTYQASVDPDGSINTTSIGKTNFWQFVQALFGANLAPDMGLAGKAMPGPVNTPQAMSFDAGHNWFIGEGIPITPSDDGGSKNFYPLMHLVARSSAGAILAQTDVVLPVSDEMDCRLCHGSGAGTAARPGAGWVFEPDPVRDYRLNILRLHDERRTGGAVYVQALASAGYDANGLYATVVVDGKSVLCARCHLSEALPGTGFAGVPPLTRSVHARHASVVDPTNGLTLDASDNRSACYRCHPGSATRCLRGAMGSAVAADGTMEMQCQSCHGSMSMVGAVDRTGWLNEPTCQNCHTGTAAYNNGLIRYTSAFQSPGQPRVPVDRTFATNNDAPAAGLSLYRFSQGHGGLQCGACHGSTHAEFPSSHRNDNIQSQQLQGHVGMLAECTACHGVQPSNFSGGPHGMHPVGQSWVTSHTDYVEQGGASRCQACHGADYRGTVLSRSKGDRNLSTEFGTKRFWRGFQIGCYACHNGPSSENATSNRPPSASNGSATTTRLTPVNIPLGASDADGNLLSLAVVSQPVHGTVGINGRTATYFPDTTFVGTETFSFAAWDGFTNSNLAVVAVTVKQPASYDLPLPAGQGVSRISAGLGALLVGYGAITADTPSLPMALANFGLVQNGVLVTEVGVPAATPVTATRLFVDLAAGINTGVAVVNPGAGAINVTAIARNAAGAYAGQALVTVGPRAHRAFFVDQIGLSLPATFQGTLTLASPAAFVAVSLRSATNGYGEVILTALPLADLNQLSAAGPLVFPQVVDGGGIPTRILLMNPSPGIASTGTIDLFDDTGVPLALDFGAGPQSSVAYAMAPNGMAEFATTGQGPLRVGYAVVTPGMGPRPIGSGVFSVMNGASPISQAGISDSALTASARLYAETASAPLARNTGIAVANPNPAAAALTLTLDGFDNTRRTTIWSIAANGHAARFVNELFPDLPPAYQGILTVESDRAVAALTLRVTRNQRGEDIYSTLPVADLTNPPAGPLYLPQVVDGGGYRTQVIFVNTSDAAGTARVDFLDEAGNPVEFPLW